LAQLERELAAARPTPPPLPSQQQLPQPTRNLFIRHDDDDDKFVDDDDAVENKKQQHQKQVVATGLRSERVGMKQRKEQKRHVRQKKRARDCKQ
jgi:hypothetical protein